MVIDYREDGSGSHRATWIAHCRQLMVGPARPQVLDLLGADGCVVLHGSTTRNVADAYSDLDCYLVLDEESMAVLDRRVGRRFIDFEIEGKPGHFNAVYKDEIIHAFAPPDFALIYELQHAVALLDPGNFLAPIKARARLPMGEAVRYAGFMHNYMEMRSYHRSADHPMDRCDRWAALSSVVKCVNFALRCARLVDGQTSPYDKWLYASAAQTPTGRALLVHVDHILALLGSSHSALDGPEQENDISMALRQMRMMLIERAIATGIDRPWLTQWWHAFDEQTSVFEGVEWPVG